MLKVLEEQMGGGGYRTQLSPFFGLASVFFSWCKHHHAGLRHSQSSTTRFVVTRFAIGEVRRQLVVIVVVASIISSFGLGRVSCNMRTSKKRRKKQSCVIPAGESNVNQ
jgi:hypothetical protein